MILLDTKTTNRVLEVSANMKKDTNHKLMSTIYNKTISLDQKIIGSTLYYLYDLNQEERENAKRKKSEDRKWDFIKIALGYVLGLISVYLLQHQ